MVEVRFDYVYRNVGGSSIRFSALIDQQIYQSHGFLVRCVLGPDQVIDIDVAKQGKYWIYVCEIYRSYSIVMAKTEARFALCRS